MAAPTLQWNQWLPIITGYPESSPAHAEKRAPGRRESSSDAYKEADSSTRKKALGSIAKPTRPPNARFGRPPRVASPATKGTKSHGARSAGSSGIAMDGPPTPDDSALFGFCAAAGGAVAPPAPDSARAADCSR